MEKIKVLLIVFCMYSQLYVATWLVIHTYKLYKADNIEADQKLELFFLPVVILFLAFGIATAIYNIVKMVKS